MAHKCNPTRRSIGAPWRVWVMVLALAGAFACVPRCATAQETAEEVAQRRRERIGNMDPQQKQRLRRHCDQFDQMDQAQRERIRQLHVSIQRHPDGEQLRGVMERYSRWLSTLTPRLRDELLSLSTEKRIVRIKEIRRQQRWSEYRRRGGGLKREDVDALIRWMAIYARKHEKEVLKRMPEKMRRQMQGASKQKQGRMLAMWAFMPMLRPPGKLPPLSEGDYEELAGMLSTPSAKKLRGATDPGKREKLVRDWLKHAARSHFFRRGRNRFRKPPSEEQLQEFRRQLDPRRQQELEKLPAEQRHHKLRRMYDDHHFHHRRGPPGHGPPDRPRDDYNHRDTHPPRRPRR